MKHTEFIAKLFEIEVVSHIVHLQVTGQGSFAAHKALNELYVDIVDLRDRYVESAQGKYGIFTSYPKTIETKEGTDMLKYISECVNQIGAHRLELTEGYLQQICDDIIELLYSTYYKLKNLK